MSDFDDFDFVDHYGEAEEAEDVNRLEENTVACALNCAFIGVGGGGGKLAKAFLDLGYMFSVSWSQNLVLDPAH